MGIRACAVLRRKRLLVGRLPFPTPRLTGVGLPPHRHVHDGGRAPHGPPHVVRHHDDVAGSEVLQGLQRGEGADKGCRDDGGV